MGNIEFRILKKIRCVHAIGNGNIDFEYMINRVKYIHEHPDIDLSFNHFIDFKYAVVTYYDKGFKPYIAFFQKLKESKIHRKWAIYTKNDMTHMTANMHHVLETGNIEVKVFQYREMALAFLGITEEDLADY